MTRGRKRKVRRGRGRSDGRVEHVRAKEGRREFDEDRGLANERDGRTSPKKEG